jgi:pimeloyl-ACP methyl ester carboxylesterase
MVFLAALAAAWSAAAQTPAELRSVPVNGTVLHYRLAGDTGTPVVFVHGLPGDLDAWDAQLEFFSPMHRVLTYSRRSHPPNPRPAGPVYAPLLHAADLAELLDSLDLAPAHLVGHSFGGYTALVLALGYPDLVRSLVLVEPPVLPLLPQTPAGDAMRRAFQVATIDLARAAFARGDSVAAVRLFNDGANGSPGHFDSLPPRERDELVSHAYELRRDLSADPPDLLPWLPCRMLDAVQVPVLLLQGEQSAHVFHVVIDELARCLNTETVATAPRAGHPVHRDNPAYFNAVVRRHLDYLSGALVAAPPAPSHTGR